MPLFKPTQRTKVKSHALVVGAILITSGWDNFAIHKWIIIVFMSSGKKDVLKNYWRTLVLVYWGQFPFLN